jgi:hypothetical protein
MISFDMFAFRFAANALCAFVIALLGTANAQALAIDGSAPCSAGQNAATPSMTQSASASTPTSCGSPSVNSSGPAGGAEPVHGSASGWSVGETVVALAIIIDKLAWLIDKAAFLVAKLTALMGKVARLIRKIAKVLSAGKALLRSLRDLLGGKPARRSVKKSKPRTSQGGRVRTQHSMTGAA